MKKFFLILFMLLAASYWLLAQTGLNCSEPIPASIGNNVYVSSEGAKYFKYTVPANIAQPDRFITIKACGNDAGATINIYKDSCGSYYYDHKQAFCDYGTVNMLIAKAGETYIFEWFGSSDFTWELSDEDVPMGMAPTRAVLAYEGVNSYIPYGADPSDGINMWYKYVFAGDGTITLSNCAFNQPQSGFYVYKSIPSVIHEEENYKDPGIINFAWNNCFELYDQAQLKVSGKKGEIVYILYEAKVFNEFKWDLSFSPIMLPAGVNSSNPIPMALGEKAYTLQNFVDESNFSYFTFIPSKNINYKLSLLNDIYYWGIWDNKGREFSTNNETLKAFYFQGKTNDTLIFGIYANQSYYSQSYQQTMDVIIKLEETTEPIPDKCANNIFVNPGQVYTVQPDTTSFHAFVAPADGKFTIKLAEGTERNVNIYKSCEREYYYKNFYVNNNEYNEYDYNYVSVKKGDTLYFTWDNRWSKFSWKVLFFSPTEFTSFNMQGRTSPAVIDASKRTINVEISNKEMHQLNSLYTEYSNPFCNVYLDSVMVYSQNNFDYSNGSLVFKVVNYEQNDIQYWTVNVTKAAAAYTGNTINDIRIERQLTPPVINHLDGTISATVSWEKYDDYNLSASLPKGASFYEYGYSNQDYLFFYYDTSTISTKVINVYPDSGDVKSYNVTLVRTIPTGATCISAIQAISGENSNPDWKPFYIFYYKANTNGVLKISGTNTESGVYVSDTCDPNYMYGHWQNVNPNNPAFYKVQSGKTYYFWFQSNVTHFSLEEIVTPSDNHLEYVWTNAFDEVRSVDNMNKKYTLLIPYNRSATEFSIDISNGATALFNGMIINQNQYQYHMFDTMPIAKVSIIAMNGDTAHWTIEVVKQEIPSENSILAFSVKDMLIPAKIDPTNHSISILVGETANINSLIPSFILSECAQASIGGSIHYPMEQTVDFTYPVVYTVENYCLETRPSQDWTVTVKKASSFDADVLSFNIHGQTGPAIIDTVNKTIKAEVHAWVSKAALTSYFELSPGASAKIGASQVNSGSILDLSATTTDFVINSTSGTSKTWKISVSQLQQGTCEANFTYTVNGSTVNFTSTSTGNGLNYSWNFDDGKTAITSISSNTYLNPGTYNVCLKVAGTNCVSEICKSITLSFENPPVSNFTFTEGASANQIIFSNTSENATSYLWDFGNGIQSSTTEKAFTHSYEYAGIYYVCLKATNAKGTGTTICKEVVVGNAACNMSAGFEYLVDHDSLKISLTNLSSGDFDEVYWMFGDGQVSTSIDPAVVYKKAGYYWVSLSVRKSGSNCFDTYGAYIEVGTTDCRASFTASINESNNSVSFVNTSSGTSLSYFWDFGDGTFSTLASPVKTFNNKGTHYVSLTIINESGLCIDYAYQEIQIGQVICNAKFTYFADAASRKVYFNSGENDLSNQYLWIMGDGTFSTAKDPVHTFSYSGYYSIRLTTYNLANECIDTYEEVILAGEEGSDCEADFAFYPENEKISFTNTSKGDIALQVWSFGDKQISTLEHPVHIYNKGGYYNVCLTVVNTSGIGNTTCKKVPVALNDVNNCKAEFSYIVNESREVTFMDMSVGNPGKWEWNFGNEKSENIKNPIHKYDANGYYLVSLKTSNAAGCTSKQYKLLNIGELTKLKALFVSEESETPAKAGGYPVDFVGAGSGDQARLRWDFGDGNSDTLSTTPTNEYATPGSYNVCYEISDPVTGASDKHCETILVGPASVNNFYISGKVKAYPIPMDNILNLQFNIQNNPKLTIELVDITGRKIQSATEVHANEKLRLNVSGLSSGPYIIRVYGSNIAPEIIRVTKK